MDEDLQSDPKILTIKKNKSGKVGKKVPMT